MALFNFRKVRIPIFCHILRCVQSRDEDASLFLHASSWNDLVRRPTVYGLREDGKIRTVRSWFFECNISRPDFSMWQELNFYAVWDVQERFNEADAVQLLAWRRDFGRTAKFTSTVFDRYVAHMKKAEREAANGLCWDDVRSVSGLVTPWSGWLCRSKAEYYGEKYCPWKYFLPLEMAVTLKLLRTRHRLWRSVVPDVWRLILRQIVRDYACAELLTW
jgi:hypothetical protein